MLSIIYLRYKLFNPTIVLQELLIIWPSNSCLELIPNEILIYHVLFDWPHFVESGATHYIFDKLVVMISYERTLLAHFWLSFFQYKCLGVIIDIVLWIILQINTWSTTIICLIFNALFFHLVNLQLIRIKWKNSLAPGLFSHF